MWEEPQPTLGVGDLHPAEQFRRLPPEVTFASLKAEYLGEMAPDGCHGVERGHRVLGNQGERTPAKLAQLPRGQRRQFGTAEPDRASGVPTDPWRQQPEHRG